MTVFEKELKRIFEKEALFADARYVGNCCYVRLTDQIRAKISFETGIMANQYDRMRVALINRNEGMIDSMVVKFSDLWGYKRINAASSPINPHIWKDGQSVGWYGYRPENTEYRQLADAVESYMGMFQEPVQEQAMGQKLC